jgi:enediyne biosynthesis protein E4
VNGKFRSSSSLPSETLSGSCVRAADVDNDGDLDLFVGTRVVPGRYPESAESILLINDGKGEFTKAAAAMSDALKNAGMITDAAWIDANNDGKKDLVVCGEWMKLKMFINKDGKLTEATDDYFPDALSGWWHRLKAADMDGDGDMDVIAGNWGLNSPLKVSKAEPATLYYGDFDNNGSVDPLICYYIQGKSYPMASRDEMTDQMVSLRQKFPTYASYSNTTLQDILNEDQLKMAKKLEADYFETTYFENDKGVFKARKLPLEANFFPVFAIETGDFDHDGKLDIILGGNTDHARIKIGKIDAGYGMMLKGDGNGNFAYVPQMETGLTVKGCIRDIIKTGDKDNAKLIFAINNQAPQIYLY